MDDDYLEIENTRTNWGKLLPILVIVFISLTFLTFFGCFIYHKYIKQKCRKSEIIPLNQEQSEYNTPENKGTDNPDFNNYNNTNYDSMDYNYTNYNSNNEFITPQPQNIYYESTKSPIDNNYGNYSGQNIN